MTTIHHDTQIVSLRFNKAASWTPELALKWCLKNNFKIMKPFYEDDEILSFKIKDHRLFRILDIIDVCDGISLMMGH